MNQTTKAAAQTPQAAVEKSPAADVRRAPQTVMQQSFGNAGTSALARRNGTAPPDDRGRPIPDALRARMERAFGTSLGDVRLHDDKRVQAAASALGAHAFTRGNDIFFAGPVRPETRAGSRLVAHEIAHVLQQSGAVQRAAVDAGPSDRLEREAHTIAERVLRGEGGMAAAVTRGPAPAIQRDTPSSEPSLDPSNTDNWDWFDDQDYAKSKLFLPTVNRAGGDADKLAKDMSTTAVPQTDDERDALEARVRTLIRLKGVAMVGQHRDELVQRKSEFRAMLAAPPAPADGSAPQTSAAARIADTASAFRAAARTVQRLNSQKDTLEGLYNDADLAVLVSAGPDVCDDEYQDLTKAAQPYSSIEILHDIINTGRSLATAGRGDKKSVVFDMRRELMRYRKHQIQGVDASIAVMYEAFPTLADFSAETMLTGKEPTKATDVLKKMAGVSLAAMSGTTGLYAIYSLKDALKEDVPPDDEQLVSRVDQSFDHLISNTDEAIGKVGSADINEFDLPGAIMAAKAALPLPLQPEVDRMREEHEARKWAWEMILALGLAVLTGLTGGAAAIGATAWAAAGSLTIGAIGVAQLTSQLKDMTDRRTLAQASTSPDGSLLGVSAPSTFEWAMFGISALLTVADLALVTKELAEFKPRFNEEPHLPPAKGEPAPPPMHESETSPAPLTPAEAEANAGVIKARDPAESRILEAGRGEEAPSLEQVDAELAIVEETEARPLKNDPDYEEQVDLENGHSWKRTKDGAWCRFSKNQVCVLPRSKKAPPAPVRESPKTEATLEIWTMRNRPQIDRPPPGLLNQDDAAAWELYNAYFDERIDSIRADFRATGTTDRQVPVDWETFQARMADNPKLMHVMRGRLSQGRMGLDIDEMTNGKAAQNLGLSKVEDPSPEEMLYPDFVWRGARGYSAVSTKSRIMTGLEEEAIDKIIATDIDEALGKYYGSRYVRRRGLPETGSTINIDEVVLNYDPRFVPEDMRQHIIDYAQKYGGSGVKISFFEF